MSNSGIPSVDEKNPLYCPEFTKSRYLKVVNRYLALRRGRKKVPGQRQPGVPVNPHSLLLLSDSSIRSTASDRILGEFLSGNNWLSGSINSDDDLPPYSVADASWSPSLQSSKALEAAAVYAPVLNHAAPLERKPSETFSDLYAPPKYARSTLSAHDSSFDVEVRREKLRFFGMASSPEGNLAVHLDTNVPNDIDYLVQQLALALPGIRLEERLRALDPHLPSAQMIMDFLVDNGHLNLRTLDILRSSDVEMLAFPPSFFDRENGLNLRGNEIYSVFGKPDAFRTLTRLSFSGTHLLDSDIVHFHHLPKLSVLILDETGIGNEAVFLLVPLKATLSRLSLAMNPDVNNAAVAAILILHRLSFLSIRDTGIDMVGLREIAVVVEQEKRVIRIRLPFSCEDYLQNLNSKYLTELKPPLVAHEQNCNQLSIHALRWNLEAHAAHNPSLVTSGTRPEMLHRLTEILKIRRLDKLVFNLFWRIGLVGPRDA